MLKGVIWLLVKGIAEHLKNYPAFIEEDNFFNFIVAEVDSFEFFQVVQNYWEFGEKIVPEV